MTGSFAYVLIVCFSLATGTSCAVIDEGLTRDKCIAAAQTTMLEEDFPHSTAHFICTRSREQDT